jgi:hypothetical protein
MTIPDEIISVFPSNPNAEIIRLYISEAAYFKAEKRGFESDVSPQNFIEKQCIVRQNLDKNKIKPV